MSRAVVLLSGGLDSATVLAIAQAEGHECIALTVEYGQRHHVELVAARRVAQSLGVTDHRFIQVPIGAFGASALTANMEVPKNRAEDATDEIPVTYVPARNTVMLSLALALAESTDAHDIYIGVNAVDYSGYPDCRPEFIAAFQDMANLATREGVEGRPFRIHAPLIQLTKPEIISQGLELGVDYSLTHSCYDPDSHGRACGACDSCLIRQRAFRDLGRSDPALAHLA